MNPSTIASNGLDGIEAGASAIEALLHASGLAHPVTQIEKLRPTHFTATLDLDGGDLGAVEHEYTLNTNALEDTADGDGLVDATVTLGDHHALVGLDTLFIAFADADADTHGVAHIDVGQFRFF